MKRILIVKIKGIGDIIMTLSMLRQIYKEEPDAEVTWITGAAGAEILRNFKLHEIVVADEKAILQGNALKKIKAVLKVWKKIAGHTFDLALIPYRDKRYKVMTLAARCKEVKMFGEDSCKRVIPIQGRKFIDEYVRFYNEKDAQDMQLQQSVKISPEKLPPLKNFNNDNNSLIVLACGGFRHVSDNPLFLRQWPMEHYKELAALLCARGYQVVITGAPAEQWISEQFLDLPVLDAVGKLSILELLSLYRMSSVVVTHDSGSLHMAGLADANVVAIFGPTSPDVFMPRCKGEYIWHNEKFACCPCYDGITFAKCADNRCMADIEVKDVFDRIEKRLTSTGGDLL